MDTLRLPSFRLNVGLFSAYVASAAVFTLNLPDTYRVRFGLGSRAVLHEGGAALWLLGKAFLAAQIGALLLPQSCLFRGLGTLPLGGKESRRFMPFRTPNGWRFGVDQKGSLGPLPSEPLGF